MQIKVLGIKEAVAGLEYIRHKTKRVVIAVVEDTVYQTVKFASMYTPKYSGQTASSWAVASSLDNFFITDRLDKEKENLPPPNYNGIADSNNEGFAHEVAATVTMSARRIAEESVNPKIYVYNTVAGRFWQYGDLTDGYLRSVNDGYKTDQEMKWRAIDFANSAFRKAKVDAW